MALHGRFWMPMAADGCLCLLMVCYASLWAVYGYLLLRIAGYGCLWLLLCLLVAAYVCFRLLVAALGCCWLLMADHGC